jgi:hypothetical protein
MNSNFGTFATRSTPAAVERYGLRQEVTGEIDRLEIYQGPNIRAFMAQHNLDPNQWPRLLKYNSFGSLLDLVEGETQLAIPVDLLS